MYIDTCKALWREGRKEMGRRPGVRRRGRNDRVEGSEVELAEEGTVGRAHSQVRVELVTSLGRMLFSPRDWEH